MVLVFTMENCLRMLPLCGWHRWQISASVIETSFKFTKRVRRCPCKSGESCDRRFCWHRRQIYCQCLMCCWCHWHRWYTSSSEFSKKFEIALMELSGELATPRLAESGRRRLPDSPSFSFKHSKADSPTRRVCESSTPRLGESESQI